MAKAEAAHTDAELLEAWEASKNQGESMEAFAARHGMTRKALDSRLYRARKGASNAPPPGEEDTERLTIENDGQALVIDSRSKRIKTLADLVKACEIDLEKWTVERWVANKWEVGAKQKDGSIEVTPLFQVKATLLPRHPEPIELSIQAVRIDTRLPKPARRKLVKGRGLILADPQIGYRRDPLSGNIDPFHDRAAMDIALQMAQDGGFDRVAWIGDLMDMTDWSDKFTREPAFYFTTQPAIYEAHWWLAQFRLAAPNALHDCLEGNHELRSQTALANHLLAAHGLMAAGANVKYPALSLPSLLALDEIGVEWQGGYPNNESWAGPVRLVHGDIARAGATATVKALVADAQETVIQGHVHRIEWASKTITDRHGARVVSAFSAGCLCRLDYVVPGHKRGQQWQQGVTVVEWAGDDFAITPVIIQNGRAVYNGRVYQARDPLPALNQATKHARHGWKF